jgi:hypothetical protein
MRRREFIVGLGSAAAWPLAVRAQQPTLPVIGIMGAASAQGFAIQVATIRQGLGEMGFVEGQNLTIEFRWAEDRFERGRRLGGSAGGGHRHSGGHCNRDCGQERDEHHSNRIRPWF